AGRDCGIAKSHACNDLKHAVEVLLAETPAPSRILILGSLYLAGVVLENHS
ncbi:MAG TPA: bifunctional folylpolyglutamate synthase/dihydrofolate synthase, partial [Thalassospira lucentensis]|nr:bifunctional folylpolyglutamate synthase/dihydrofolate synthase [Thalassospira lucentensis]